MSADSGVEELDGEPITARDALAAGDDFVDASCPLLLLQCPATSSTDVTTVHAMAVGNVGGKLLVALPSTAWNRKVARRVVPSGMFTKVFAAEVAAVALQDRSSALEGQTLRIWLGTCAPASEHLLVASEEEPDVPFGLLPDGNLLLPAVEALAAIWANQMAVSTPAQMEAGI